MPPFSFLINWVTKKPPQLEKYIIHQSQSHFLGLGQEGTAVYIGREKQTNQKYAIKVICKKKLSKKKKKSIREEAEMMRELSTKPHPNIVKMIDFFEDSGHFYIVMELMEGGELFDQIARRGSFTEAEARQVITQVSNGVLFLHQKGIVHRDLKPENLLCGSIDSLENIKICDFGMAKKLGPNLASTPCGTVNYVAPEVIQSRKSEKGKKDRDKYKDKEGGEGYGMKVDVWSLGVILYLLLCGLPPFFDTNPGEVLKKIKANQFDFPENDWDYISDAAKDLICQCLVSDPSQRIDIFDFISHPWLRHISSSSHENIPLKTPSTLLLSDAPIRELIKILNYTTPKSPLSQETRGPEDLRESSEENTQPEEKKKEKGREREKGKGKGKGKERIQEESESNEENDLSEEEALEREEMREEKGKEAKGRKARKRFSFLKQESRSNSLIFVKTTISHLDFELPDYYSFVKNASFAGKGLVCLAKNEILGKESSIQKYSKFNRDPRTNQKLANQIYLLRNLKHENIIDIYDGFISPSDDLYLSYEPYDGNLRQLLISRPIEEREAKVVVTHILRALMFIHSAGIVHGNLRPHCILFRIFRGKIWQVFLSDFEEASKAPIQKRQYYGEIVKNYWPPERLITSTCDFPGDIWALGCILAEMFQRKVTFPGQKDVEILHSITHFLGTPSETILKRTFKCDETVVEQFASGNQLDPVDFPERFPHAPLCGISLLRKMLIYDPNQRTSIQLALSHPLLNDFRDPSKERMCANFHPFPGGDDELRNWRIILLDRLQALHSEMLLKGRK